jgi:hypothetical protein
MALTYEPIATISMSGTNTATFSSIPNTYTDLRVVVLAKHSSQGVLRMIFNSDTAGNYSHTNLNGNGTSVSSPRDTNTNGIYLNFQQNLSDTEFALAEVNVFSYTGSTNKTALFGVSGDYAASRGEVSRGVGLWRNTSVITSISFIVPNNAFASGSTATLYGIKAA